MFFSILLVLLMSFQKFYLLMKVGGMSFNTAIKKTINYCFEKELLSKFSYKGKTKEKFIGLQIFSVIYGNVTII